MEHGQRGILIFISDKLKYWDLKLLCTSQNTEMATIKIQFEFLKSISIVCIYRHPNYLKKVLDQDISNMKAIISKLLETDNDFLILGDFNFRNQTANPLINYCTALNIEQIIKVPTRKNQILDFIFVRKVNKVIDTHVFDACIADHLVTDCVYSYVKYIPTTKKVEYRAFSSKNTSNFVDSLQQSLQHEYNSFDNFLFDFMNSLNTNIPNVSRTFKVKTKQILLSQYTKSIVKKRNKLLKHSKRMPSIQISNELFYYSKMVKRLTKGH